MRRRVHCRFAGLDDVPGIWKLCTQVFEAYRRCEYADFLELCEHRWLKNPARAEDHVFGWVLEDDLGEVVGFLGVVPIRVKIGPQVYPGVAPTTWGVQMEHRASSLALYAAFTEWAADRVVFNTTANEITSAVNASLGFGMSRIPISDFDHRLLWLLKIEELVSWKLGQLAETQRRWAVLHCPAAVRLLSRCAPVLLRLRLALEEGGPTRFFKTDLRFDCRELCVKPVEEFTDAFDRLWNATKENHAVTTERCSAFLSWRHLRTPRALGRSYALECSEDGRLLGYITLRRPAFTAPGHFVVTDLYYDMERTDVFENLMNKAFILARAEGGSVLEVFGFHPSVSEALRKQHPFVLRRKSLEVLGRGWSVLDLLKEFLPGASKPSSSYWYRVPSPELIDICAHSSWWPSGVDGDLNL